VTTLALFPLAVLALIDPPMATKVASHANPLQQGALTLDEFEIMSAVNRDGHD